MSNTPRAWPSHLPLPQPLETGKDVPLSDGLYESRWPTGRTRLLAAVSEGRTVAWLTLEEDGAEGCLDWGATAERYYRNGRMETFSHWDDSSAPFRASLPFESWVEEARQKLSQLMKSASVYPG